MSIETLLEHLAEKIAEGLAERVNYPKKEVSNSIEEEYLTTKEAKKFLRIGSSTTLKDYRTKGYIPEPTKSGGRKLLYKKSDLKNYLDGL